MEEFFAPPPKKKEKKNVDKIITGTNLFPLHHLEYILDWIWIDYYSALPPLSLPNQNQPPGVSYDIKGTLSPGQNL